MTLDFVQIVFKEHQASECYPFARIYHNEKVTPYFENDVIKRIVPALNADIISVCSWRLAAKRGDMFRLQDKTLTVEKIFSSDFDVAVLTPRSPTHKPLHMASHWHGKAWNNAFDVFKRFIKTDLGVRVPEELSMAIYENHFIAKREIYHDYVKNWLTPAIDFIDKTGTVFLEDAGYSKRKSASDVKAYTEATGRKDWPIAPFILERLFSIYCEKKGFKIIPL